MITSESIKDSLRHEDAKRAQRTLEYANNYTSGFMTSALAKQAESEQWADKLETLIFSCASLYANFMEKMKNTPMDIYRHLPGIRGVDKIEWRMLEDIRKQVDENRALALFIPPEVIKAWKGER